VRCAPQRRGRWRRRRACRRHHKPNRLLRHGFRRYGGIVTGRRLYRRADTPSSTSPWQPPTPTSTPSAACPYYLPTSCLQLALLLTAPSRFQQTRCRRRHWGYLLPCISTPGATAANPPPVPRLVAPARRHCRRPPPRGLLFHRRQDTVGATRPLHARLVGHPPDGPNRLPQPLPLPRCPVLPRRGGGRVGHEVAGAARASVALNCRAGCLFAASTSVARGSASAPAPPHTSVATARRARWSVREWSWRWEMSTWPSMPA